LSSISVPTSAPTPVVLPLRKAIMWVVGTLLVAFAAYYVIGVEQGAVSMFGGDTHVHEFLHDARHFLGFPCH
jgi:Probable cobalt transporter subunit (CbtB)